tara:strand:- start:447 stop:1658 length:1212 start_codon:yes stop_codon:yes gene_type:complete
MSLINGKFHNVAFTTLSSSAEFSGTRLFKGRHRIPHRFKHGSSSKEKGGFFDESLISSDNHLKVLKLTGSFTYVGLRFDKYQTMVNNLMSSSASSPTAYQQMSASFFDTGGFGSVLSTSSFITLISEDNESGILTASYTITGNSTNAIPQASGMAPTGSNDFIELTINNTSDFSTAATFSFAPGGTLGELHQQAYTSSFKHRFYFSDDNVSSNGFPAAIALSGSESGSVKGQGTVQYINGANAADGTYTRYIVKGKIFGDGENDAGEVSSSVFSNTSSVTFLPTREIVVYSTSSIVRSGSFKYNSSSATLASQSGVTTTLFYASGSNGPSGSFTGSTANTGSHIFLDATFTTAALSGYYIPFGNLKQVLHAFKGGTNNDLTGSGVGSGIEFQIPKFTSSSILP